MYIRYQTTITLVNSQCSLNLLEEIENQTIMNCIIDQVIIPVILYLFKLNIRINSYNKF